MKLHEQLQALVDAGKLTADETKELSTMVDGIKASTTKNVTADFEARYQEIEAKNKDMSAKLSSYTKAERKQKINGLTKDLTDSEDKLNDAIQLANITDEDDDEAVVSKIKEVISGRKYLQAEVKGIDLEVRTGLKKSNEPKQTKTKYGLKVPV